MTGASSLTCTVTASRTHQTLFDNVVRSTLKLDPTCFDGLIVVRTVWRKIRDVPKSALLPDNKGIETANAVDGNVVGR